MVRRKGAPVVPYLATPVRGGATAGDSFLECRVRDPETPRDSGWPTMSGQPLECLNVVESNYGISGASWIVGLSIEIGD